MIAQENAKPAVILTALDGFKMNFLLLEEPVHKPMCNIAIFHG